MPDINTGLFGTRHTFVPVAQAAQTGENVQQVEVETRTLRAGGMGVAGAGSDRLQRTRLGTWTSAVITPSGRLLPGRRTEPSEQGS